MNSTSRTTARRIVQQRWRQWQPNQSSHDALQQRRPFSALLAAATRTQQPTGRRRTVTTTFRTSRTIPNKLIGVQSFSSARAIIEDDVFPLPPPSPADSTTTPNPPRPLSSAFQNGSRRPTLSSSSSLFPQQQPPPPPPLAQLTLINNVDDNKNSKKAMDHPVDDTTTTSSTTEATTTTTPATTTTTTSSALDKSLLPPLPQESQPLGYPLPIDEHACSVSLPTWSSVVGYEEGHAAVTNAMLCGYPRFVYHPYVKQLMHHVLQQLQQPTTAAANDDDANAYDCIVLPTKQAARRCQVFLQRAWQLHQNSPSTTKSTSKLPDLAFIGNTDHDNDNAADWDMISLDSSFFSTVTTSNVLPESTTPPEQQIRLVQVLQEECYAVVFPKTTLHPSTSVTWTQVAKAYWQHTGEIVTSRRADFVLSQLKIPLTQTVTPEQYACHPVMRPASSQPSTTTTAATTTTTSTTTTQLLRQRIAEFARIPDRADHVFLAPSGMAAIYRTLCSARRRHWTKRSGGGDDGDENDGGMSVVYGFPYLDTLKLCSRPEICPGGVAFFGKGHGPDLQQLEELLARQRDANNDSGDASVSVLFTEVPSNPLLHCPDLYKLRELANEYNFCLAVDDTISSFCNVDLIQTGLADVVCTSLTKLVSGRGDAIAGSCIANPHTPVGQWMQQDLKTTTRTTTTSPNTIRQDDDDCVFAQGVFEPDASAILENSVDFEQRSLKINETAEQMAEWFAEHDDIDKVYYPKFSPSVNLYHQVQTDHHGIIPRRHENNDNVHHPSPAAGYGGLISIVLHPHICQRTFYDQLNVAKGPSLGTNFTLVCPYTLLAHYHELEFAQQYDVAPNLIRISIGCLESVPELQQKFQTALQASRLYPKLKTTLSSTTTSSSSSRSV